jgi:hypothetical protein
MTSNVCAAINTETVATITAISDRFGRDAALAIVACDARTTATMTKAWTTMLQMLMAPPIMNWRTIASFLPLDSADTNRSHAKSIRVQKRYRAPTKNLNALHERP